MRLEELELHSINLHAFIEAGAFAPKAWLWSSACTAVTLPRCKYVNISILRSWTQAVIVSSSSQSALHMLPRLLFIRREEKACSLPHVIHMPFHCVNFYPWLSVSLPPPLVSPLTLTYLSLCVWSSFISHHIFAPFNALALKRFPKFLFFSESTLLFK